MVRLPRGETNGAGSRLWRGERTGGRAGRLATAPVGHGGAVACETWLDGGGLLSFERTNERVLVTACLFKHGLLGVPRRRGPFLLHQHQFPKNLLDAHQSDGPLDSPGMARPLTSRSSCPWGDEPLPPTSSATCQATPTALLACGRSVSHGPPDPGPLRHHLGPDSESSFLKHHSC